MNFESNSSAKAECAREIGQKAALWLTVHERGAISQSQQQEFDTWMASSLANRVAYWRLKAAWSRSERLVALRPAEPASSSTAGNQFWSRAKAPMSVALVLAACLAGGATYMVRESGPRTFATGFGERKVLKLADGSTIELNTDSSVRISVTQNSRRVWLDGGEAYFKVKHDAEHAFTVTMGDRSVTDLGTQFSIRREPESLTVSVIQGRVLFDTVNRSKTPNLLTAGDTAVVAGNAFFVRKEGAHKLAEKAAWRHGMLVFDQVSLADAAAEFNRYNDTKIVVQDRKAARRTIGATFPIHSVAEFVDVAQDVLKLHVDKREHEIVISE